MPPARIPPPRQQHPSSHPSHLQHLAAGQSTNARWGNMGPSGLSGQQGEVSRHTSLVGQGGGGREGEDESEDEARDPTQRLTRVRRWVELVLHGILILVSLYALVSITTTIRFQTHLGYLSLTALFLFFISGVSALVAACYLLLAWYVRTDRGRARLRVHLESVAADAEKRPPATASSRANSWALRVVSGLLSVKPRCWILAIMAILSLLTTIMQWYKIRNGSNCNALTVQYRGFCKATKAAVAAMSLNTLLWVVWLGWWSFKTFSKAPSTTKSNITQSQQQQQQQQQQPTQQNHGDPTARNEVAIAMPEDPAAGTRTAEKGPLQSIAMQMSVSNLNSPSRQSHQQPPGQPNANDNHPHDAHASTPGSESDLLNSGSLGLGIDVCTKDFMSESDFLFPDSKPSDALSPRTKEAATLDRMNMRGPRSRGSSSANKNDAASNDNIRRILLDTDVSSQGEQGSMNDTGNGNNTKPASQMQHQQGSGFINSPYNSTSNSPNLGGSSASIRSPNGLDRARSERLRHHAKIFPRGRSSTGDIFAGRGHPLDTSCIRNTPMSQSREILSSVSASGTPFLTSQHFASNGSLSPCVSAPGTPLSRRGMGYMGNQTMKALNNIPKSASMGYMAAVNNMGAYGANGLPSALPSAFPSALPSAFPSALPSAFPSALPSPLVGNGMLTPGPVDMVSTPISIKSNHSMPGFFGSGNNYFLQTQAEHSMDEHLRAIRRRSFAAESITGDDLLSGRSTNGSSATDQLFAPGSPAVMAARSATANGSGNSNFRMSFSSPNLTGFRRRSSLGLKSVLTSIVSSPVSDSSLSSSSEASSPSSSRSPRGQDGNGSNNSSSGHVGEEDPAVLFAARCKKELALSAQDLLRAEYGDAYVERPRNTSKDFGLPPTPRLQPNTVPLSTAAGSDGHGANANHVDRLSASTATASTGSGRSRSGSVSSALTSFSTLTTRTSSSGSSESTLTSQASQGHSSAPGEEGKSPGSISGSTNQRILIGTHRSQQQQPQQPQQPQQHQTNSQSKIQSLIALHSSPSQNGLTSALQTKHQTLPRGPTKQALQR